MTANEARKAIGERIKRCLAVFEPGDNVQVACHPEEVKALLAEHCPTDELKEIRDGLKERTPTHVVLRVSQAQELLHAAPVKADAPK